MIDNFLGIDTEGGGGGVGDTGHYGFWPYNAACSDDSFFQVKSPILHNTRDGSEFYVPFLSPYM